MIDFRVSSIFLLFVAAALAGCVGSDGSSTGTGTGDGDVPEELSDDKAGVEGSVVDDSLNPVAGAEVAVITKDGPQGTMTDEAGAFRLVNLEPGTHQVLVQKLGFESGGKSVTLAAGEVAALQITLTPIAVAEPRTEFLIGDGYFSCGAYFGYGVGTLTWGNLHACVWDDHQPRFSFEVYEEEFMGIVQEVTWEQASAATSKTLMAFMQYKPVCSPLCNSERDWDPSEGDNVDESPVRAYYDMEGETFDEDPALLHSMTFPAGENPGVVVVFQQRMTHYITIFYGQHGDLDTYTGIPDA